VDAKKSYIYINKLKNIFKKFLLVFDCIKFLYKKIQFILFSFLKSKALFTKILSNLSKDLYNSIIENFNSTIVNIV